MQRALVKCFRFIPVSFAYGLTALVIPFYMLFDRRGYSSSYRFFRNRIGRGRIASFFSVYANEFKLGQVIMDRFALYAGRHFNLQLDGQEHFDALSAADRGFIQVNAHVGNSELAGYSLRSERKKIYTLVFGGETQTVMQQRDRMFSRTNITMVPVADDMSHLFALNAALLAGDIVNMPGDRLFGSSKDFPCVFFGDTARFPAGPFLLAARRDVPMIATFVMKEGIRRYQVFVRRLGAQLPEGTDARGRAAAMAEEFAGLLEDIVRRYPTQWFNFYDFWR